MHFLHLEDSLADAELITILLRREWPGCKIRQAANSDEYREALEQEKFDLILSDYSLPGFDGLSALALAQARLPRIPFLFLSGTIGEERAVEALKRGATDYIIKDRLSRLIPAIRQAMAAVVVAGRREQMEMALRDQASLLDRARDAIIATNLDQRIAYWNASAERMYGWNANEVFGRRLDELNLGFDPQRFSAALAQTLDSGEWRGELRLHTRAGKTLVVESTWSLVLDNDGRPRSILYIDTDVTERRKRETQLLRTQRMESIGTLAGGVAHDLNNVLTPILLTIELLAEKAVCDDDRMLIEKTRASAIHGAALVQQLLAFARGTDARRTRIEPSLAIATLAPLIRQSLPTSVQLVFPHQPGIWPIHADATQFNQVLINLCINARDAMPEGGRIEVVTGNVTVDAALARANPGAGPGPNVRISVHDSGHGIPPNAIDKIFDPFFTTKAAGKGTGLGLSMVAGIMRSHGGFVQVESEPGRGTAFHLYFPAMPDAIPTAAIREVAALTTHGAGEGILLIEDEPLVRNILQLLLQRAGYRVFPAADAASGLAEFDRHENEVALVVTDMMLPDLIGTEVVRTLRQRRPSLPVIAISGLMASGKFDELLRLTPAVECLAKPLTPAMFLAAVRRSLPVAQAAEAKA